MMAQKHMADISELLLPLRKQRAEWLKVVACPKCGKPSHKETYQNRDKIFYVHFKRGVYAGSCVVYPTQQTKHKATG